MASRIADLLAEKSWSQSDLARKLSITPQAVQGWVSGKTMPRGIHLQKLSQVSDYPAHWFFMPRDAAADTVVYPATPLAAQLPAKRGESQRYRVDMLPIQVSAGHGAVSSSEFVETVKAIEYTHEQARQLFGGKPASAIKMVTVKGDSMAPTIEPGDMIFVDVSVDTFDGDGIYVFVFGNMLYVKRLQMLKHRLLVLSDNAKYQSWHIEDGEQDEFHVIAKVLLSQSVNFKRFG
ncbi:S24 family peptidase [Lonsdalea quercina]|uniref:LexA family transcriptional regulator n=1 Tax=Lonsdalea quercina TaxID=71657 RepID=UPI0039765619